MTTQTSDHVEFFDYASALDRCCGDEDFLAEMVDLLVTSTATQFAAVEGAVTARNAVEIAAAAHALKGTVGSMTSSRPYLLAQKLEWLGKSGTCDRADGLVSELRSSIAQLLQECQSWATHRTSG